MIHARQMVPSVAEFMYLDKVKWLEMYGVDLHPAKVWFFMWTVATFFLPGKAGSPSGQFNDLHCVVLPLRDQVFNLNGPRSLDTFPFKKIMYNSILAYVCPLLTKLCPSKDLNHGSAQIDWFFNPSFWGPPSGTLR